MFRKHLRRVTGANDPSIEKNKFTFDPFGKSLPPIFVECISYLDSFGLNQEGLFRVPGFMEQAMQMKVKFDIGSPVNLSDAKNVHTVASLLKYYLSELPQPLLTFELLDCFMLGVDIVITTGEDRKGEAEPNLGAIRSCVRLLPPANKRMLCELSAFLKRLDANSSENCMTASNIATCFAPIFVRREIPPTEMSIFLEESKKAKRLAETFIQQHDFIFETGHATKNDEIEKKPMKKEFIRQMERGTLYLASTLIRKELEMKQQQEDSENNLSEYSSSMPDMRRAKKKPKAWKNGELVNKNISPALLATAKKNPHILFSPQLPPKNAWVAVSPRRSIPSRRQSEDYGDENVRKLAKLLLAGNMTDASILLKDNYSKNKLISYEGDTNEEDQPHGMGKAVYENGEIYEGNFVNGEKTGKAKACFQNGNVYRGDFVKGIRHGQGSYVDYQGNRYEGEFVYGKRTGYGKLIFSRVNYSYEGQFVNGVPQGFGKTTFTNGDIYEGEHDKDERHGFGMFKGSNGGSYKGYYARGKRDGPGFYIASNGSRYKGTFKNNAMSGFGEYVFASGDTFIGELRDGKFEGEGIYHFRNESLIEGQFKKGTPTESRDVSIEWLKRRLKEATTMDPPSFPFTLSFDEEQFVTSPLLL